MEENKYNRGKIYKIVSDSTDKNIQKYLILSL